LAAASVLMLVLSGVPADHKSIHQLEYERHEETIVPAGKPDPYAPLLGSKDLTHEVMGFYPYWMGGYDDFHWELLSIVAWFSVGANADGSVSNPHGWPPSGLVSTAHTNGVKVVLTVTCFSGSTIYAILNNPATRMTLAQNLLDEVMAAGADGVNIDFEGVYGSQRDNLTAFMQELADLFHTEIPSSHVSLCTPAVDWRGAFDYRALARAADALFIMAYDYHWSGGDPGPVSPLYGGSPWGPYCVDWTVQDYKFELDDISPQTLILGVPFYGYEWPTVDLSVPGDATGSASAYTYSQCQSRANDPDYGGRRWDDVSLTPYLLYDMGGPYQLWYDDAESLGYKFDYLIDEDVGGVGIWALNYEGGYEDIWDEIRDRFYYIPSDDDSDDDVDDDATDDDQDDDDIDDDSADDDSQDDDGFFYNNRGVPREEEDRAAGVCAGFFD